ncbi:MAG: hypothetical protein JWO53_627 [Chlamydiia bacterium]|nr:hypothetical protein [Chlamydiia bacterium]
MGYILIKRKPLEYKDCLTNELLQKRFKSQFDLILYAIKIAENKIKSGNDNIYAEFDTENLATAILEEIANNKDQFDRIEVMGVLDDIEEEEILEPVAKSKGKKKAKA